MKNMIEGLYEAHLPVSDLEKSIAFYQHIGLELACRNDNSAFFWTEKGKSWVGLWQGEEYKTKYHPSLRHIAFRISYENMKRSLEWMKEKGIEPSDFGNHRSTDPFVRPHQGNASVYFLDPDGNSLEFMCFIEVPEHLRSIVKKISIDEWEAMLQQPVPNN